MEATYIYFLPLSSAKWDKTDEVLLKYLPDIRRQKTLRYLHDSDKRLSLYAPLLLSYMLKLHYNIDYNKQDILWNTLEKPYLISRPDIDFNFSHTYNAILCGISSQGRIGVDIEACKSAPFEIMPSVFHAEEIDYIDHFTGPEKDKAFFELWTRKEAYTKEKGVGLACNLPSINTLSVPKDFFHIWYKENYICTVFQKRQIPTVLTQTTEHELYWFIRMQTAFFE